MIALYIILAVVGVILLLLHCRVYVNVAYKTDGDAELSLSLSYLFLKIPLMPKKEKKIRLRDYSYKNYQKRKKKETEKARRAKKKADEKAAKKKANKSASSTDTSKTKTEASAPKKKKSVVYVIYEIRDVIFDVLKRFPSKFRLDVSRLKIRVGGSDAASAAITYGVVTEAVGALLTILEECSFMRRRAREHEIMITPDFCSGKIDADVKIRLSIKPASVLSLAFRFIKGFISRRLSASIRK